MEQQALFETDTLTTEVRRKVERLLSAYRSMGSVIAAMELDVPGPSLTANYTPSESKRSNLPSSQTEKIILMRERLEEKKRTKQKLDIIYEGLDERRKRIWDLRYTIGRYDDIVIDELNISRRQYFREKTSIIREVAEAFYWL